MLPSTQPAEIRGDKQVVALVPVPFEFEKVELVGLYRLRYRTRNARTGAWWARLQNDYPKHVALFRELSAQHSSIARSVGKNQGRAHATLRPEGAVLEGANGKLSAEQKLKRLDEIFPGVRENILGLSRFSDWEHSDYDWHLDVEPTLLAIAQRNGPTFLPATLLYFDEPIADTHRARIDAAIARGTGQDKEAEG